MTKPKSGRKIPQFDLAHHRPFGAGGRLLGTRTAVAVATARHENLVRRYCEPVACRLQRSRTGSPVLLYDMEECEQRLLAVSRRVLALSDPA